MSRFLIIVIGMVLIISVSFAQNHPKTPQGAVDPGIRNDGLPGAGGWFRIYQIL